MQTAKQSSAPHSYANTLMAASGSGFCGASASFFFKSLKIRIQSEQSIPSMSQLGARTWFKETFRGTSSYVGCLVSTSVVQQMTDTYLKRQGIAATPLIQWSQTLFAGALGGVTYNVAENIILEQQRKKLSPWLAVNSLFQQSPTRMIRGLPFIMGREAVFGLCTLKGVKEGGNYAKQHFGAQYVLPAEILVGILGATISHPFDTSSTTMQTHNYTKPMQAVHHLLSAPNPIKAIYRGLIARYGLFTTSMLAISKSREYLLDQLEPKSAMEPNK